jgi:hypothetical protein
MFCHFVPFRLVIILSVIILFTASDFLDLVSSSFSLTRQYVSVSKHNSYYLSDSEVKDKKIEKKKFHCCFNLDYLKVSLY